MNSEVDGMKPLGGAEEFDHLDSSQPLPEYQHNPLPPSYFRLLRFIPNEKNILMCEMGALPFHLDVPFCALSYTWGTPIYPEDDSEQEGGIEKTASIICNDKLLRITPNLADACTQLQAFECEKVFWIDAICINQKDLQEKGHQVQLMGEIYRKAAQVIVWLGKESEDLKHFVWVSNTLFPAFKTYIDKGGDAHLSEQQMSEPYVAQELGLGTDDLPTRICGFFRFCWYRKWMSRFWTIQEALYISKTRLLCGQTEVPYPNVIEMDAFIRRGIWYKSAMLQESLTGNHILRRHTPGFATRLVLANVLPYRTGIKASDWYSGLSKKDLNVSFGAETETVKSLAAIIDMVFITKRFGCADGRDKLFAAFGLMQQYLSEDIKELLKPDYTSTAEKVYTNFAQVALTNIPRLTLFSYMCDPAFRNMPLLPSWVPDLSVTREEAFPYPLISRHLYDAMNCCNTLPRRRHFEGSIFNCEGVQFDTVEHTCAATNHDILDEYRIIDLLRFCCLLPEQILGVNRVEACWRTMTGNYYFRPGHETVFYPAAQFFEIVFKSLVISLITMALSVHPERDHSSNDYTQLLKTLDPSGTSNALPNNDEMVQYCTAFRQFSQGEERSKDEEELLDEVDRNITTYGRTMQEVATGRRFFFTSKGFMGLGRTSTRPGDRIMFLRDSLVPLTLREREDSNDMQLIGDCYLYGFMNGEVLDEKWGVNDLFGPIRIS